MNPLRDGHTGWCARDHQCGLGQHRAHPVRFTIPGLGSAVLTRIRTAEGSDHAEIRLSIRLTNHEPTARDQLATLLVNLRTLLDLTRHQRPHQRAA